MFNIIKTGIVRKKNAQIRLRILKLRFFQVRLSSKQLKTRIEDRATFGRNDLNENRRSRQWYFSGKKSGKNRRQIKKL